MVVEKFQKGKKIKFCQLSKVFHDNLETVSIILGFSSIEGKKLETLKISFLSSSLLNIVYYRNLASSSIPGNSNYHSNRCQLIKALFVYKKHEAIDSLPPPS